MLEKPVAWLGSSLEDLRAFPGDARRAAGYRLGRVQQRAPADGLEAYHYSRARRRRDSGSHTRRASSVLRREVRGGRVRLHAFEKRTRQTPHPEIALAKKRFADLIRRRAKKPEAP